MDRLFRRNDDYVKVLISETEIYTNKREQAKIEDYIYTFIGEEYRKAAQPYFTKAKSGGYLETLIDLCNQIESIKADQEDAQNRRNLLLQALTVATYKPKLLFGKKCNSGQVRAKSVRKFEKTIQKIYRDWDKFQAELDLCQHYIGRGTTRLNRPAESDRLAGVRPQLLQFQQAG